MAIRAISQRAILRGVVPIRSGARPKSMRETSGARPNELHPRQGKRVAKQLYLVMAASSSDVDAR